MNLPKVQLSPIVLTLVKLICPFFFWMFIFRDFILGRIALNMDTITIYSVTKFYFNNLLNGVVPLWDPFVFLGTPFYAITLCNLFNPVTLLVPLLKVLGLNYYGAFMVYIVVYFFLGLLGFYCLAKELFRDQWCAYLAYLMLLCSGIGASLFNQLTIVELFVPAVWFFVFLLKFIRTWRRSDFLGLSYSLMIVMISYVPFYFLTLLMFAVVLAGVLYWKECGQICKAGLAFVRRNIGLVLLALLGIMVSCLPLVVYKMIDSAGDVVSPGRHCNYASVEDCYNRTLNEQGGMSYKETSQSGNLAERIHWQGFFLHLDKISYGIDQFFYLPLFCFLVIALAAFIPIKRSLVYFAMLAVFLTLIGFANTAPLHRFFYDQIFFFKYFRNLFFFQAYIIPLVILLCVGSFKRIWLYEPDSVSARKAAVLWAIGVHVVFFVFFLNSDGVIATSWICLGISWIVFTLRWIGFSTRLGSVWAAFLIFALVVQPWEVFGHYAKNAQEFKCSLSSKHIKPEFAWVRPVQEPKSDCKIFKFVRYESFYNSMAMQDARGYIGYPVSVTRGVFLLSQWINEQALIDFTRYKLFFYDQVRVMKEEALQVRALGDVFVSTRNAAYVINSDEAMTAQFDQSDWGQSPLMALQGPSGLADVAHFDVNRLTLNVNLPQKKFLVYTDGYTRFWKVLINGKHAELLRANVGFKGVWVPAGKSTVEFRYQPPGGGVVYLVVSGVLVCFLLGLFYLCFQERNWPWRTGALENI